MQLNMVTPMDIGLERQDLVDDSEMFDLGEVEGGKARRGVKGGNLGSDDEMSDEDEMDGMPGRPINPIPEGAVRRDFEGEGEDEYDSDASDSERKARRLEESLDLLYESYQQTKLERDAKHKVKEQRRKRAMAEGGEFRGFNSDDDKDSDESDHDDEEDFDPAPLPSESEGDSSDEEVETQLVPSKATKSSAPTSKGKTAAASAAASAAEKKKKAGLLTNLKAEKVLSSSAKSRQAEMWFDQPAFKGLPGGLDALLNGGDDDASDAEEEDESFEEDDEGVKSVWDELDEDEDDEDQEDGAQEESESESDDDFDGAREEFEEDEEMEEEADIEAEEKAEIEKAERIASAYHSLLFFALAYTRSDPVASSRARLDDGGSDDAGSAARQPGADADAAGRRGLQPPHRCRRRRRSPFLVHRRRTAPLPSQHPDHEGRRPGHPGQAARAERATDQEGCRGQGAQEDADDPPPREDEGQGAGYQRRRRERVDREGKGRFDRKGPRPVGKGRQDQEARDQARCRSWTEPRYLGTAEGSKGQVQGAHAFSYCDRPSLPICSLLTFFVLRLSIRA